MTGFRLLLPFVFTASMAIGNPLQTTPSTYGSAVVTSNVTFVEYSATALSGAGGYKVHIEASWSGAEPVNAQGYVFVAPVAGGAAFISDASMSRDGTHSLSITSTTYAASGSSITHSVSVTYLGGQYYVNSETLTAPAAPSASYKITYVIPANNTLYPVLYEVFQNGAVIGSFTQSPGAAASELILSGLTSNAPTILTATTAVITVNQDTGVVTVQEGAHASVVSTGTPLPGAGAIGTNPNAADLRTVPSVTPIIPNVVPVPAPVAPSPSAPPAAPTPAPPRAAPTPPAVPNPTPSGTGGVTKADLEKQTNDLAAATLTTNTTINDNSNAVITAVNTAATAQANSNAAIVTSVNSLNTGQAASAAAVVSVVNTSNKLAVEQGIKLDSIYSAVTGVGDAPAAAFPQTFTGTLGAGDVTPVTSLVSKLPSVPAVLPTDIGSNSHFVFALKFPPLTDTYTVDVDMSPYSTPVFFLRGIMKACLSLLFFFLVVNTLKKATS